MSNNSRLELLKILKNFKIEGNNQCGIKENLDENEMGISKLTDVF